MHDRFNRPIRPDHQEAGGRPPPRQQRQQVQGRVITPVQVFEDQDQGVSAVSVSTTSANSRSMRSRVTP